jgi:hypothetical protein
MLDMKRTRNDAESIKIAAQLQRRDTLSETVFILRNRRDVPPEKVEEFIRIHNWACEHWDDDKWRRSATWSIDTVLGALVSDYRRWRMGARVV